MALIVSPTVIIAIDDTVDISMFYGVAEENEEKGKEKNIEIESIFYESTEKEPSLYFNQKENMAFYMFKNYPKPHLNLVFPPPDFLLL